MSVIVFVENWDGKFKKLSFELISYARQIADKSGSQVIALSIGTVEDDELQKLGNYGAHKILKVEDERLNSLINKAYASVITQAAEKESSDTVLFSHNATGKALAPRVAVRLKAGAVTGVTEIPSSLDPFEVKKKVFTNKAFANVRVRSVKNVLTLFQNSVEIKETENNVEIEAFDAEIRDQDLKTRVLEVNKITGKVLLTDAEIVVSGGRGMKGPEKWQPLEDLAAELGAAIACSRPVSDEGWRPHEEHVGQTGKIIAPNLYFALGISGAIQHLGGVNSSKYIVAVNTDKDAPIFEAADYGIVGDVHKILPELTCEIKKMKDA